MMPASRSRHRFRWRLIGCLLICLAFLAATPVVAIEQPQELLIGIEPEHNIFDQVERYRYLAGYLSDRLGVNVRLTIMSRYGEVIKRFKALKLDGAFLTSYTAYMGIKELHLVPIANPVSLNGESTSQGYIFARKDSDIRSINDMAGNSFVFVDPATLEGYLFPLAFFQHHGVRDFFIDYIFPAPMPRPSLRYSTDGPTSGPPKIRYTPTWSAMIRPSSRNWKSLPCPQKFPKSPFASRMKSQRISGKD